MTDTTAREAEARQWTKHPLWDAAINAHDATPHLRGCAGKVSQTVHGWQPCSCYRHIRAMIAFATPRVTEPREAEAREVLAIISANLPASMTNWARRDTSVRIADALATPRVTDEQPVAWVSPGQFAAMKDEGEGGTYLPTRRTSLGNFTMPLYAAPTYAGATVTGEVSQELLMLRALLCLSGFAGQGLTVEGFEDAAVVYSDIAHAIGMEDADDADLRAHIDIEDKRAALRPQIAVPDRERVLREALKPFAFKGVTVPRNLPLDSHWFTDSLTGKSFTVGQVLAARAALDAAPTPLSDDTA